MNRTTDNPMKMPTSTRRGFVKALGLAAAAAALPGRGILAEMLRDEKLQLIQHSTFVMGQIANVTIYHRDAAYARRVVTALFDELRRLESLMSVYDERSQVSAINRDAGREAIPVAPEMIELITAARGVAARSSRALDITVNPLLELWGFRGAARTRRPSDREVIAALDAVGIDGVRIEGSSIGLAKSGASLDLGGVAVGYALDRIAAIARREGIDSALLELSGDFYAIGTPPDSARGWEIGIEDPRHHDGIWRRLYVKNQALSTSGNYASTVVYNAHAYGHIFDPARGFPAERLLSATVVAPTAFDADAYSTALFVNGNSAMLPAGSRGYVMKG
jgi:thiamine biosynthesis lipoprotein